MDEPQYRPILHLRTIDMAKLGELFLRDGRWAGRPLMAADYVLKEGNERVLLCERGIRTFETATRFTLDLSAVPWLKLHTHLPVIVDPSHASGDRRLVEPLARAAAAVGADGIIVEVHQDPAASRSVPTSESR